MLENQVKPIYLAIGSNIGNKKQNIEKTKFKLIRNNVEILDKPHEGYIFDKIEWGNQYFQYTIYIPNIKIITSC